MEDIHPAFYLHGGEEFVRTSDVLKLAERWREEYDHTSETLGLLQCAGELEEFLDD